MRVLLRLRGRVADPDRMLEEDTRDCIGVWLQLGDDEALMMAV